MEERGAMDPFAAVGLQPMSDHTESTAEAEAFARGGGSTFRVFDEDAYLLRLRDETGKRTRITHRRPLSAWLLQGIEASTHALGDRLFHVLGIRDLRVDVAQGRIWIEADWFDGPEAKIDLPQALAQVQRALEAMETVGVVHGALAPEWIRSLSQGEGFPFVRIGGFGLGWMIAEQRERVFSGLGTSIGDPRFMAPEVTDGHPPTAASDRYSAAASLLAAFYLGHGAPGPLFGEEAVTARMACTPEHWLPKTLAGPERVQLAAMLDPCPDKRVWISEGGRPIRVSNKPGPKAESNSIAPPGPPSTKGLGWMDYLTYSFVVIAGMAILGLGWTWVFPSNQAAVPSSAGHATGGAAPEPVGVAVSSTASARAPLAPAPVAQPAAPPTGASQDACCASFLQLTEACVPPKPKTPRNGAPGAPRPLVQPGANPPAKPAPPPIAPPAKSDASSAEKSN